MPVNLLPLSTKFYLADDIRADNPAKPMIFGLYADDTLKVVMQAKKAGPTREAPIVFQSLAILVSFIDCKGSFDAEVYLYQPNGNPLIDNKLEEPLQSEKSQHTDRSNISFIVKFIPFSVPEFGTYRFVIKLDGNPFEYKFKIDRLDQIS